MGMDFEVAQAFAKSQLGAGTKLPTQGTVFLSVKDSDKESLIPLARELSDMGFHLIATGGTCKTLQDAGLPVTRINKVMEGQPHIADALINGQVQLIINTTKGPQAIADGKSIRRLALMNRIPYYTVLASAKASVQAIRAMRNREIRVASLQSYFKEREEIQGPSVPVERVA
jgi:carbamoyl-phosphate synthase large subunit